MLISVNEMFDGVLSSNYPNTRIRLFDGTEYSNWDDGASFEGGVLAVFSCDEEVHYIPYSSISEVVTDI